MVQDWKFVMKDRNIVVECRFPITSDNKRYYTIDNETGDTIAMIHLHVGIKRNEFEESYSLMLNYQMRWNPMYNPTEQERNSAEFLFSNLTKVVQWDLSSVLDVDVSRINDILPIKVKINKVKGESPCQNAKVN